MFVFFVLSIHPGFDLLLVLVMHYLNKNVVDDYVVVVVVVDDDDVDFDCSSQHDH